MVPLNPDDPSSCDFYGTEIMYNGGYLSGNYLGSKLADDTGYNFELCEKCLSDLIDTLKIPPQEIDIGYKFIGVYE